MSRKSYFQLLDRVARESLSTQTDLAPRILSQIQKGKSRRMPARLKVVVLVVLLLAVAVIALAKVPAVAAAIQRWFGYVPNVGLVHDGQIRILAEPITSVRDGVKLTIEQVVADPERTTVVYSVDGLNPENLDVKPAVNGPGCVRDAILRLKTGDLEPIGLTGTSWISGFEHHAMYASIPSGVSEATFVLPCVRSALPGKAPENWELALSLVPAPPGMKVLPVIEIPTAQAAASPVPQTSQNGISMEGVTLTLDRAVQMDDGYLIYATVHWEATGFNVVNAPEQENLKLQDANGQPVTWDLDLEATMNLQQEHGRTVFVIKTAPIEVAGPLTITIDALPVDVNTDASFSFDPGENPQPGQVWDLNQTVDLGHGHSLKVVRAAYPKPPAAGLPQQAGLSFELESATGVQGAVLVDREYAWLGGGGGGGGSFAGRFSAGFTYQGSIPQGPITVSVESMWVQVPGHWEASWTPPQLQASAAPYDSACLTRDTWEQALTQNASVPAGLDGRLGVMQVLPPTYNFEVAIVQLASGNIRSIGAGSAPSLSSDGKFVAYVGPNVDGPSDGLYMTDLASGDSLRIPGTSKGDVGPLLSPDGGRLLFTRGPSSGLIGAPGPYTVMLANIDGSDMHALTQGPDAHYATAWMPDGQRIITTSLTRTGSAVSMQNVQTGDATHLFDLNYNGTVVVSPDGTRLAFEEMLPLDKYGLYVSDLDGSHRTLLADGDPYTVTVPFWSPDGKWVVASVHDPDPAKHPTSTLVLIEVDTCRIIPLPGLTGYVTSWLP